MDNGWQSLSAMTGSACAIQGECPLVSVAKR
jgi:hypothetical protein